MRIQLMSCGVAALVVGLFSQTVLAAPAAVVDATSFDFGFVPQQAKISHVFEITSVGDDSLRILQVVPGCGCTKAPLEKAELAPGESTRLEVIFSTGQYRGRVAKHPSFVTNEESGKHALEFISNVVARPDSTYPVVLAPSVLDFSASEAMEVTITNVSDHEVKARVVAGADGTIEVTLPEAIPVGGSAVATVRLVDAGNGLGFERSFTIQLDDSAASRFTVPVRRSAHAGVGAVEPKAGR